MNMEKKMADTITFNAHSRTRVGKGASRAARREGRVPAVIYGANKDPLAITMDPRELTMQADSEGFFATLYEIDCDGQKERVLCRDLQRHPVKDTPVHADFLRVTEATRINVEIPVHFENEDECPGLRAGGVLNVVRHTVEVICRAGAIPESIIVDLSGHEIGDSIHISEVNLPSDVAPTITDRDFTIATIAAPTVVPAEDEEGAEGEEGADGEAAEGAAGEAAEGGESGGGDSSSED